MGRNFAKSSLLKVFYVSFSVSLALQQTKPSAKRQAILATFFCMALNQGFV